MEKEMEIFDIEECYKKNKNIVTNGSYTIYDNVSVAAAILTLIEYLYIEKPIQGKH